MMNQLKFVIKVVEKSLNGPFETPVPLRHAQKLNMPWWHSPVQSQD